MEGKPTAADTWSEESIDWETFKMLYDLLDIHPDYEVRPVVQMSREDSGVVKTVEVKDNAESTLSDFKFNVMAAEGGYEEMTGELREVMEEHGLARSGLLMEERGNG